MPIASLPGPHGIGDLGDTAYKFVDSLKNSGQTWWQMVPIGPLGYGNSPYQILSAFAGNPLLINLDFLAREGVKSGLRTILGNNVRSPDLTPSPADKIDYGAVIQFKMQKLIDAFRSFVLQKHHPYKQPYALFCRENQFWLKDYAIYGAIKNHYHGSPWWDWDEDIRLRKPRALKIWTEMLSQQIQFQSFLQFVFHRQWDAFRSYARKRGIGFIGDIPFYVAHDSADVWAHPHLFYLDKNGQRQLLAGVPPDSFSADGQLWGNPLYRWDLLRKKRYDWWIRRIQKILVHFDAVRLDHFIGFYHYWAVPAKEKTAKHGRWVKGPQAHFFHTLLKQCPHIQIVVEDLGSLTKDVEALRDQFDFPGMKILQYAFETHPGAEVNRPYNISQRTLVYTGTHDNNTILGWTEELRKKYKKKGWNQYSLALAYNQGKEKEFHWDMIRLGMMSSADICIFPIQDVLGLGSEARINRPGTADGNWEWRLKTGMIKQKTERRLKKLAETYSRI